MNVASGGETRNGILAIKSVLCPPIHRAAPVVCSRSNDNRHNIFYVL
jgi:hypothetical protein